MKQRNVIRVFYHTGIGVNGSQVTHSETEEKGTYNAALWDTPCEGRPRRGTVLEGNTLPPARKVIEKSSNSLRGQLEVNT